MNSISDFPNFDVSPLFPTSGLVEQSPKTFDNIVNFNRLFPNQPTFFISRCSWDLLVNGISRTKSGELKQWVPPEYEVFAFVFCLATGNISPNIKKEFGYFRIRTLLKKRTYNTKDKEIEIFVETENIAYVDINKALYNQLYSTQKDCLEFIYKNDTQSEIQINRINSEVVEKTMPKTSLIHNLDTDHQILINNEGCIFGKKRIWDDLLITKFNLSPGSNISIAMKNIIKSRSKILRSFYFNFAINDPFDSNIECPKPPACK